MEQSFKNKILAYLLGQLDIETPTITAPTFINAGSETNNFQQQMEAEFGENYIIRGITQSETSEITVLYGNDAEANNFFIVLLDKAGSIIQIITEYANGNPLDPITTINVNQEDGTFYAISSLGNEFKFLMLNNFTVKLPTQDTYQVTVRYTYALNNFNSSTWVMGVKKSAQSATYLIYGNQTYSYNTNTYNKPIAVLLKVNVGQENEETLFTSTSSTIGMNVNVYDATIIEENDSLSFTLRCIARSTTSQGAYTERIGVYTENVTTAMTTGRNISLYGLPSTGLVMKSVGQNVYIGYNDRTKEQFYCLDYINDQTTDYAENIYKRPCNYETGGYSLLVQNNIVFFLLNQYNGSEYVNYVGIAYNNNAYAYEVGSFTNESLLFGNSAFNLCNFYIQNGNTSYNIQTIFNPVNYNGSSYTDINSMVPNSGTLTGQNDEVLFARNLYNKTVTNNTTTSVIEVPNTYLNDVTITEQNLFSETNSLLNNNAQTINKNIYETLNINFINTLNMINENIPANPIINATGASRLNNSISATTDYSNAQMGKYKVNYSDGHSVILPMSEVTYTGNTGEVSLVIYVGTQISNIQLVSNDEQTVYQQIEVNSLNLEVGKFYKLTQKVKII